MHFVVDFKTAPLPSIHPQQQCNIHAYMYVYASFKPANVLITTTSLLADWCITERTLWVV